MRTLRVLLVEDDKKNVDLWKTAIDTHNLDAEKHGIFIATCYAATVDEARDALDGYNIDAAVVDIRLKLQDGSAGHNTDGNTFIRYAVETKPIGIVVYSGQATEAEVADFPQIEVMDRGDGLSQVISWLVNNAEMFAAVRNVRNTFDRITAKLFFRSLWPRWKLWKDDHSEEALHVDIARHAIAHTHDTMLLENEDGAHAEEVYFVPSLRPRLDTGDLIQIGSEIWIVLTPRCDLARNIAVKSLILAQCEDVGADWEKLKASESKSAAKDMDHHAKHKGSPKQHFLPRMRMKEGGWMGPWFVQFHHIKSISPTEESIAELLKGRFASLAPQFVPSLVERFGNYFSRIGTPDIEY